MIQKQALRGLRQILATLYPTPHDARRIIEDAGLNAAYIPFDDRSDILWFEILSAADRSNKVKELVEVAGQEYPHYREQMVQLLENGSESGPTKFSGTPKDNKSDQAVSSSGSSLFDQRGQTVSGNQTNIAGNVSTIGGLVNTGTIITGDSNIVASHDQVELADQYNRVGLQLTAQGDYVAALPYLKMGLDIRQKFHGKQHPDTAGSLNNLGSLLTDMGNYAEARRYYEQALAIRRAVLGEQHPDTASSLNNLGALLQALGDYGGAKGYYEQALTIRRVVLGEQHPDTALTLNNLGTLLQALGDYAGAKGYYEQALTIRRVVLGEQHPDTALTLNNLGTLLQAVGDYVAAKSYCEQALAIRRAVLGEQHPGTAGSLNDLGELHRTLKEYTIAQSYYEQALSIYSTALGDVHPTTANILNNLGLLRSNVGDYAGALTYFEQALAIHQSVLGEQHPDTAHSLSNLGLLQFTMGNYASALKYLEPALKIYSSLGEQHPDTLHLLEVLSTLSSRLGNDKAALHYGQRWLAATRAIGDRQAEGQALNQIATSNIDLGEYATASEYARTALTIGEELADQALISEALVNLAITTLNLGDPEEAQRLGERALSIARGIEDRRNESRSLNLLGSAISSLGQPTLATPHLQQAWTIAREINDRRLEGQVLNNLALVYGNFGNDKESIPFYTQAINIAQEINDTTSERNLLGNLGFIYNKLQQYTEAIPCLHKAVLLAQEQSEPRIEGNYQGNLADAYAGLQQYSPALEHYQAAIHLLRSVDDRRGVSYRLGDLGDVYLKLGQTQQAIQSYLDALGLARVLADQRRQRLHLQNLAQAYCTLGQIDNALQYYNQLLDQVRMDDRRQAADLLLTMGELAQTQQQITQAHQFWTEARDLYAELQLTHAQSVASLLTALETSHPDLFSLLETVKHYMVKAGFTLTPPATSTMFLCQPQHNTWLEHTQKTVPLKVLSGIALEMNMVLKLVEESSQLLGEAPHCIIVVCDRAPTDGAWLQIGAQRAAGINIMPVDDSILRTGIQENNHRAVLLDHLKLRYLGKQRDLYDRQNPISDRLNFFGREKLADELIDTLAQGHAVALFGLRKMGKTSLLNYMRNRLSYPVAVIDLETGVELGHLYDSILDEWASFVHIRRSDVIWKPPPLRGVTEVGEVFTTAVRDLLRLLEAQPAGGASSGSDQARVAVFVDEIEEIYPYTEADLERYLAFARIMRGLAQQYPGKFGLVVAGVDPNIVRTDGLFGRRNPFYSFFQTKYLQPLNKEDCKQMIRNIGVQMGLHYTEDALDFVAEMSGGHPYWARKLCSLAFQEHKGAEAITGTQLQEIAERFIEEPSTAFLLNQRGLWGDVTNPQFWSNEEALANKQILLKLAEVERSTSKELLAKRRPRSAYSHALLEMNARSILNQSTADSYWIHLQLFRQWIQYEMLEEG